MSQTNIRSSAGVSFVIPAFNEEAYLPDTLRALKDAVSETGTLHEIIVVNDNSTDRTHDIAAEAGCRVVDVKLRNIGAVRNAGAAAARMPWLIFVDADTLVSAATLNGTIERLERGDAGGGARVKLNSKKRVPMIGWILFLLIAFFWQTVGRLAAGCYMFCRKVDFENFGGFDEQYFAAEELFFSRQVKRCGRFTIVPAPVFTSARKLHQYSALQLMRFILKPLFSGRRAFKSREGLEILYEDRLETENEMCDQLD